MENTQMSVATKTLMTDLAKQAMHTAIVANLVVKLGMPKGDPQIGEIANKVVENTDISGFIETIENGYRATLEDAPHIIPAEGMSVASEFVVITMVVMTMHLADKIELVNSEEMFANLANAPFPTEGKLN